MSTPESSLPQSWLERIFATMRATYGATFDRQWETPAGVEPAVHAAAMMTVWGKALAHLQQSPQALTFALDNLPEFPPTLPQFKALCSRRPGDPQPALVAPRLTPEEATKLTSNLRKLQSRMSAPVGREWAKVLQARIAAGQFRNVPAAHREMTADTLAGWTV